MNDRVSIAFRRLVQSSLVQGLIERLETGQRSPLPFGVWFSRHQPLGLFALRLLFVSPLPFGVWFSRHGLDPG